METLLVIISIILGIIILKTRSPVTAILSVIGIFTCSAGLLAASGFSLLALFFIIIYVGAIAILFLFIIFLLNLRDTGEELSHNLIQQLFVIVVITIICWVVINTRMVDNLSITDWFQQAELTSQLSLLTAMYSTVAFWMIGIILLLAMMSVILLTRRSNVVRNSNLEIYKNKKF